MNRERLFACLIAAFAVGAALPLPGCATRGPLRATMSIQLDPEQPTVPLPIQHVKPSPGGDRGSSSGNGAVTAPGSISVGPGGGTTSAPRPGLEVRTRSGFVLEKLAGETHGDKPHFSAIAGLAIALDGTVYAADPSTNQVLAITPTGGVTVAAGDANGVAGFFGDNVPATGSRLNRPMGILIETRTNVIFVAEAGNGRIRYFTPGGRMYTYAGGGVNTDDEVPQAIFARLNQPCGMAVDGARNLYFTEQGSGKLRRIAPTGRLSTLATLSPGLPMPIAASSHDNRLWVGHGSQVLVFEASGVAPLDGQVAYEASGAMITGLAYDQAGTLYVMETQASPTGPRDAKVSRLAVTASGTPTPGRIAEPIAGMAGAGESEGDYTVSASPVPDARYQRLAGAGHISLAIDLREAANPAAISGALLVGNAYEGGGKRWAQVLRLTPRP